MAAGIPPTFYFNDTHLIQNCINGHRKSQKKMYYSFHDKMFCLCLRYVKNRVETEDVVQEAFIKLFRKLPTFKGEGSFEGWVRRIFVNTALEYLRDKKQTAVPLNYIEDFLPFHHLSGLDNLYEKDIISISMKLDKGYCAVFNLYAVKGYSHKEIADELGITESTSKSQLSRARAKLRNMMEEQQTQELRYA